jgi:hypothetical protein
MNEVLGRWHLWLTFGVACATVFPMHCPLVRRWAGRPRASHYTKWAAQR